MNDNELSKQDKLNLYIEERKLLVQQGLDETATLDKAILTISSGTFGFTITFIKQIIGPQYCCEKVLVISWILLILSILSTLFSHFISQKAFYKAIDINYTVLIDGEDQPTNIFSIIVARLNIVSITSLTSGLFLLAVFIAENL